MSANIKRLVKNRNCLILIIVTFGMLPELVSVGGYYIKGDITAQMLPFVYETKRMFTSGVPFWSWNTYFGDNFIASYAYYTVFNPFTWVNCLFPYKYLGLGFTLVLYLKFLACGYVSQNYLKKIGFDEKLSLIGCLLYTFSSWAITNVYYYMFLEPMILLPVLLIFIERFIRGERHMYTGLILAAFVVIAVNYYFATINLIAGAIYFLCRLFFMDADNKDKIYIILKAAGCAVLGIACASFVLVPVFFQLSGSSHESLSFDFPDISLLSERLMWLLYPKTHIEQFYYIHMSNFGNSTAVNIVVFGLLPAILLFSHKGFRWIKCLTMVLLICYFSSLNGLFSLFASVSYTRWVYFLSLCIIICTLYYIRDFGLPSFKSAVLYCAIVYGAYILFAGASIYWQAASAGEAAFEKAAKLSLEAAVVLVNAIALIFLCSKRIMKTNTYFSIFFVITVCTSLQFFVFTILRIPFQKEIVDTCTEEKYFARSESFRGTGKFNYRSNFYFQDRGKCKSCNFGLICNIPSVETYHSVQNIRNLKWNSIVSYSQIRNFMTLHFTESFESMMSVKNLITVGDTTFIRDFGEPQYQSGLFTVYESDHYIPMGFVYNSYILSDSVENVAKTDTCFDIPMLLLASLAIDKKDENELSKYLGKGTILDYPDLDSLVFARRIKTCDSFIGNTQGFDSHLNLDSASVVFFSVVADDGFKAYIDGEPTKLYETNLGFSSVIVPAGSHDITFRYFPPGLKIGLIISMIGFSIIGIMYCKRQ